MSQRAFSGPLEGVGPLLNITTMKCEKEMEYRRQLDPHLDSIRTANFEVN
jgi:hypothetical protein